MQDNLGNHAAYIVMPVIRQTVHALISNIVIYIHGKLISYLHIWTLIYKCMRSIGTDRVYISHYQIFLSSESIIELELL
jgi:hypothetical protein